MTSPTTQPVQFRCLDCNAWVRTSRWSRIASAQLCGRCYRARAGAIADELHRAAERRRLEIVQAELFGGGSEAENGES